jgi:hypothetical protein
MEYRIKKQISILIQLAKIDNVFTDAEKTAILKIGAKYGVDESEVKQLFDSEEMSDSLAPMTLYQKANFLIDMILVLLADKEIHEKEEGFTKMICRRLGFNDAVVDFLIEYNTVDRAELVEMMLPYTVIKKK